MKRIPKYMWIRWFMWVILFSVAIVCVSLIESRLFLLESLLIVVIVMAVAIIVLYEQSALAKHLEGKYISSITEDQFEAVKRYIIDNGTILDSSIPVYHTIDRAIEQSIDKSNVLHEFMILFISEMDGRVARRYKKYKLILEQDAEGYEDHEWFENNALPIAIDDGTIYNTIAYLVPKDID